jgi:serine/threonine-protein kinase
MDQRCVATHAKLLAGTCPWCGRPIINGRVIDYPLTESPTASDVRSALEPFVDTQIEFESKVLGHNLKQVVEREGPLDWRRAAGYIAEVARQLGEFHGAHQVHRNVRPGNIYLDQEKSVELGDQVVELGDQACDFLYASIDEESIPSIVDCLAPEQAINSHSLDGRADIYSLGCTFYFLLAGRMPFPSGSVSERLLKHQTATPEPLSALRPDVPTAVVQVCEKMLAKKPLDRYATAKDVVEALAKVQTEG